MASGLPDFYRKTMPGRASLATNQSRWRYTFGGVIPENSILPLEVYTVPAGYNLVVGGIFISGQTSSVLYVEIYEGDEIIAQWFQHDNRPIAPDVTSHLEISATKVLKIYIYNEVGLDVVVAGFLTGYLEKLTV